MPIPARFWEGSSATAIPGHSVEGIATSSAAPRKHFLSTSYGAWHSRSQTRTIEFNSNYDGEAKLGGVWTARTI